jgi:hypothetical protein
MPVQVVSVVKRSKQRPREATGYSDNLRCVQLNSESIFLQIDPGSDHAELASLSCKKFIFRNIL